MHIVNKEIILGRKKEDLMMSSINNLKAIYSYTGQSDIADIIMSRQSRSLAGLQCGHNVVVRHLVSTML